MLGVEVHRNTAASDAGDRILFVCFGVGYRAMFGLLIVRQGLAGEPRGQFGAGFAVGVERLDGGVPELVLHGRGHEAGDIDLAHVGLLVHAGAVRLASLKTAESAPVLGDHFLHVPPAMLLERVVKLLPAAERHGAGGAEQPVLKIGDFLVGTRLFEPGIVGIIEGVDVEVLREFHEVQRVGLALARGLHGAASQAKGALGTLRDAPSVHFEPVTNGQQDIRAARSRGVPKVRLKAEVEHVERFPVVGGVRHVHVVAGANHAAVNLVGRIGFAVCALHDCVCICPNLIPVEQRHLFVACHTVEKLRAGHVLE